MLASTYYSQLTGRNAVYNITLIDNIPSIMKHGILSYELAKSLPHNSIAMTGVQSTRDTVRVTSTKVLHEYANLYFSYRNPMLFKRRDVSEQLCILKVSSLILDIDGCVVSDRNAASPLVRFYTPIEGMKHLDFNSIFAKYWINPDPITERDQKTKKCAEILIPEVVQPEYIVCACTVNNVAAELLQSKGFDKEIVVNRTAFFL